ncbi:hypothetical protein HHK36_027142 [Tetracentron sinense]|uniref:non-specific serine/threonine protein kinase n=1 Tax=Tetracentron sinense TaxID=13715 RepID=A0A834YKV9_TETSI|nr:hypothetical protein HHK36_027142 [Tetracentron sinense]
MQEEPAGTVGETVEGRSQQKPWSLETTKSGKSFAEDTCGLNFKEYPFQPAGECVGIDEKISDWNSFPTTVCCRNALTALSQALALQARDTNAIFLGQADWNNCSGSFQRQNSSNTRSCGFDKLYSGSSKCSSFSLSSFENDNQYREALDNCSQLNSSFDYACPKCTQAIIDARDHQLAQFRVNTNDTEKAICGVAVVISVAAAKIEDRPFVSDFYSCLHALDIIDSVAKALLAILIATMGLMLVVVLIKYVTKKKVLKPVEGKEISTWSGLYRFSKIEIENAINFSNRKVCLGAGSAGRVYKGVLPSGQVVAIKHIYKSNMSDSFDREVEGLSRIRHPNLVCLFGCCIEGGEQYLVYEYCSAGNLAHHLLKRDSVLSWDRRVKILRDCALALRYLHHYIDGCIVHRDIKLTNILLTDNMDPKLSDFGLAKMLGMEESKVFTDVRGTIGYMDPEYMSNAKLTCGSDIYSFGIVTLQLLSGRKVIELDLDARDQLTRKAKDVVMRKRPLKDFEDPRLLGNLNLVDFDSILQVAVLCVAKSSKGRPTIDVVFEEMEKAWKNTSANMKAKIEMNPSTSPQSRSFDVASV